MKSPRFEVRAATLCKLFSASNLERVWKEKVRVSMREQFLCDGVEHFDFHVFRQLECEKLSQLIMSGAYVPQRPQRILVEKSKGLCRQLVIPSLRDALVLQCLSDALYSVIRGKAPTTKAFFEPREHRFSAIRSDYGTFAAWLNFQKELFRFSKNRAFIVLTDVANFYDNISYVHLRNALSSIVGVDECILDMLIYILSDLLWQPDYTPRVEIGLPQINLDAPRLLAHCFLYELDKFLACDPTRDFARYMDDIDIGVDTIVDAKRVLKEIDLVLQTKQVRLNSGKTLILRQDEAAVHFRIRDNARLDALMCRLERRLKSGLSVERDRRFIELRISQGFERGDFDTGNGEKILKRWIGLAGRAGSRIPQRVVRRVILQRPGVRDTVFGYIRRIPLSAATAKTLAECVQSGLLVDDAGVVDLVNHLVETNVPARSGRQVHISRIIETLSCDDYFSLYNRMWMQSKFGSTKELFSTISSSRRLWNAHERLGRVVGSFRPIFVATEEEAAFKNLLVDCQNAGFRETYEFQHNLATEHRTFARMFDALKNPNPSRGTRITHPKWVEIVDLADGEEAGINGATLFSLFIVCAFE